MEYGNLQDWKYETDFYKNLTIPYYIIGANFGPYRSPEFVGIVKNIVKDAKYVCFRDKPSYEVFQDIPTAHLASDVVFSLNTANYPAKTTKSVVFSMIDCSHRFTGEVLDTYELEMLKLTQQFVDDGYTITYMSFCKAQNDLRAIRRIVSKASKELQGAISIYSYEGNMDEALSVIASCEVVVAARFHATILGLVFGKKVLPIIYSNKTAAVLKDIGFTGAVFDLTERNKLAEIKIDELKKTPIHRQVLGSRKQFEELDKVLELRAANE